MTPAKIWLQTFLAGFSIIVFLLVITLFTPIPYGDLSRLGRISDAAFGWTEPAPTVDPRYLQSVPAADADVLVIGDSFSMTGRWQSQLVKAGYRVDTVFWGHFGEAICQDFDGWVRQSGFRGKLIVIESVERLLDDRLKRSAGCTAAKRPMRTDASAFLSPPERPAGFKLYSSATLMTGWITYFNTRRARQTPGDTEGDANAKVRPVPDGCELFSHEFCRKALFYGDDDANGELAPAHVSSMQAFSKAHPTIPIVWMIVPNKTTVYVEPDRSKEFVDAFKRSDLGPDLFTFAMNEKRKMRDFYFPNDTHMSMHGQLLMGQLMLDQVRKIVPGSQPTTP